MRRPLLAAGVLLLAIVLGDASGASAQPATPPGVDVVKVHGVIDDAMAGFVRSAVERARGTGATVVLQLDSRGSFGDEAIELARFVRAAGIPVVTWVGPSAARASGGALLLAYSASLVTMAPGAGIGPARPFDLGTRAGNESASTVADGARQLRALAAGTGASAQAIDRLIRGAQLAAGPALRSGAISFAAPSVPELLQRIDRTPVRTASGEMVLNTVGTRASPVAVRFRDIGFWARILHAVSTPTAVYVLLLIGLWGIAFEFTQPGIGMAGIAGVLSLALAGYGLASIPVNWWGIGLILAGTGLQALDVVIRRVALLTGAGTIAFLAGSLIAWWGVSAAIDVSLWLILLATMAGLLLFGFGMTVALRSRERVRA
ncbi:MAG: nodulation protein NfeD, partial [Actinomycetota bacterium]